MQNTLSYFYNSVIKNADVLSYLFVEGFNILNALYIVIFINICILKIIQCYILYMYDKTMQISSTMIIGAAIKCIQIKN